MGKVVNKRELSQILGVSERSLSDWQMEPAFPILEEAEKRGEANLYDTERVIQWWLLREISKSSETDKARRRLLHAQAGRAELDLARARGEVISAAGSAKKLREISRECRNSLLSIPDQLAPVLAAERSPQVIHSKITGEIKNAIDQLCKRLKEMADETESELTERTDD